LFAGTPWPINWWKPGDFIEWPDVTFKNKKHTSAKWLGPPLTVESILYHILTKNLEPAFAELFSEVFHPMS
jgi:hypothetical protein